MEIQKLDENTINKIAAGEVIERPASALKELLENSADSGATRIEVDFESGGKKFLRILDNGKGISGSELPLALERHATSKIRNIDDLSQLHTFGFRGEALSSLAAVSRFTLQSNRKSEKSGFKIESEGGRISQPVPVAPIGGTEAVVRDLFFNVPARQKFLKSDAGETSALKKVVKSFALAHPEISITLKQNGKPIEQWTSQEFFKRSCEILGVKTTDALLIENELDGFRIQACAALPEKNLSTQQGIWVFVQNRPVQDRMLVQAIIEGYRNLVMESQYPQVVLKLFVSPTDVDVNVHPSKAQVKFADSATVFRFVSRTLKEALEKKAAEKYNLTERLPEQATLEPQNYQVQEFQPDLVRDAVTQYNQRSWNQDKVLSTHDFAAAAAPSTSPSPTSPTAAPTVGAWSSLQLIGQLANTYIVSQSPKALVLIDQHAAHERVLFERLKAKAKFERQASLFEESIELEPEAIEALTQENFKQAFENIGFEFEARGPTVIGVQARPSFLIDISLKPLMERMAEQIINQGDQTALQDVITDLWATMACHGAIRAGRVLSREEMQSLLNQMDEFSFSQFCPHGRPVSQQLTIYELEKMFKRII